MLQSQYSWHSTAQVLNICDEYCNEFDIRLNAEKSNLLYFGKQIHVSFELKLNSKALKWKESCKYLGITLLSGKSFNCSVTDRIKKFYWCANSILRIEGRSSDTVMLRVIETHCIPLLTYAIEIVYVQNRDERRQLRVAYNSVFRRIFGYRWSELVTALQHFLNRPTWEELVEKRHSKFVQRLTSHNDQSLARAYIR